MQPTPSRHPLMLVESIPPRRFAVPFSVSQADERRILAERDAQDQRVVRESYTSYSVTPSGSQALVDALLVSEESSAAIGELVTEIEAQPAVFAARFLRLEERVTKLSELDAVVTALAAKLNAQVGA